VVALRHRIVFHQDTRTKRTRIFIFTMRPNGTDRQLVVYLGWEKIPSGRLTAAR
jgi:hypothetical protein